MQDDGECNDKTPLLIDKTNDYQYTQEGRNSMPMRMHGWYAQIDKWVSFARDKLLSAKNWEYPALWRSGKRCGANSGS